MTRKEVLEALKKAVPSADYGEINWEPLFFADAQRITKQLEAAIDTDEITCEAIAIATGFTNPGW